MYEHFPTDGIERSYGIIPLRFVDGGRVEVLIIQHSSNGETGFPKGHAEAEDASPLAAARRELREETGVEAADLLFNPYSNYFESSYTNPRTGKQKTVVLWAAEIKHDAQITIQPEEIMSYRFVDINNVRAELSHQLDRDTISQLLDLLPEQADAVYPRMLLFGDSLTQFAWQAGGLGQLLSDTYQRRMDIVGRGFSGYNTSWALQLLPHVFPASDAKDGLKLAVVWLGANDAANPDSIQHVPVPEYTNNLKRIIQHIRQSDPGARIVLITPSPVIPPARERTSTIQYVEAAKEVGQQLQVPIVDCFNAIEQEAIRTGGGDLYQGLLAFLNDGLHLLPAGYRVIYDGLLQVIEQHYPDLSSARLPMVFPPHDRIASQGPKKAFQRVHHYV